MAHSLKARLQALTLSPAEAALLGLLAAGCRLAFASPPAYATASDALRRASRWMSRLQGALLSVQSDEAAVQMAAGAALRGARAAALVSDTTRADGALSGLDDLGLVVLDMSGRVPIHLHHVRGAVAPHTPQTAYDAGRGAFLLAEMLHGPQLVSGLAGPPGPVPAPADSSSDGAVLPIFHTGPDDADLLIVGAGSCFADCEAARQQLEGQGMAVAHLHLIQLAPFPGAIVAPAITSARRVLVVETGGPGTLAGLIRHHLGVPVAPFGELPRVGSSPVTPAAITRRAGEVMAL